MKLFIWRLDSSTKLNILAENVENARNFYYANNYSDKHFNLNKTEPEIIEQPFFFTTINPVCPRCGCPGTELHSCPYKSDINNDDTELCTCCDDCQGDCAMNI